MGDPLRSFDRFERHLSWNRHFVHIIHHNLQKQEVIFWCLHSIFFVAFAAGIHSNLSLITDGNTFFVCLYLHSNKIPRQLIRKRFE